MTEERFDVVVVGGGGSGLAAAIEARAAGRSVVLLEKNAKLGGSTAWSIGSISASGTPHQMRRGIQDRPEDHYADMPLFAGQLAGRDNDELRRILCNEVPDVFRWLQELGVRFYGPVPEPPHRRPRMHNVLPNSLSYIYHLDRHARRSGIDIRLSTRASALATDGEAVTGVACGQERLFQARCGIVLATGDFTNDPELKARYMGMQQAKVEGRAPARCAHHQRRSGVGPRGPLHRPRTYDARSSLAALARARVRHGVGHGSCAASAATLAHHELSHHSTGAIGRAVQAWRDPRQSSGAPFLR
jgi:fumarate reductase flavoprotein subunit